MSFLVERTGLYDLPVDSGRLSFRGLGIPVGGPADRTSWALANALVGNENACAIEVTLFGPVLRARAEVHCAFVGAPFPITVDGQAVAPSRVWRVRPGQLLEIGTASAGLRGYLAVAGGFVLPSVLGSRSAFRPVQRWQTLPCQPQTVPGRRWLEPLPHARVFTDSTVTLRVLPGPFWSQVADALLQQFWTVGPQSNRMGIRLHGLTRWELPGDLPSQPVCPGTIQATTGGLRYNDSSTELTGLVILGVDAQTIGGYPRVAHVIEADWDLLGQLRPGQQVRFVPVSLKEARRLLLELRTTRRQWVRRLLVTSGLTA